MHKILKRMATSMLCTLALTAGSALAQSTVRVGQSLPLTGALAELGTEYRDGINAYFSAVNAKGGVNGKKLELVTLDDAYVVEKTVENTKKLIEKENVFALVGMFGSANYAAALPIINQAQIPSLAPYSGSDSLRTQESPTTFWLRASYGAEAEKIVDHLTTLGVTKIAVFYQDDAFGKSGLAGVEKALEKRKLKVVASAAFDKASNDVRPAVKTISAADPQGVVMVSTYKPTAAFVKEMRATGKHTQYFALSVVGLKTMQAELGPTAVGIAIAQVVPYPNSGTSPLIREFLGMPAEFMPKSGPTYTALEGYMAGKIFVEGLRRAGPQATREKFLDSMNAMKGYDLGGFVVNYSPNDRLGSKFVEVTIIGSSGRIIR